jgi:hypothetical protein
MDPKSAGSRPVCVEAGGSDSNIRIPFVSHVCECWSQTTTGNLLISCGFGSEIRIANSLLE